MLIIQRNIINKFIINKILFLIFILFSSFIIGIIKIEVLNPYFILRDIVYFIQPIIYIMIGYLLFEIKKDTYQIMRLLIISSFLVTLYKLFLLILNPSLIFQLGLHTRYEYDFTNSSAIIAFIVIYYSMKFRNYLFNKYLNYSILIVSLLSIIISFSRTYYVALIIALIIPYIVKIRAINILFYSMVLLILFIIFGGLIIDFESTINNDITFLSKIMHSLNEMIVQNYTSNIEINHNWRGYEAYLGLKKYYNGNLFELIFGQGLGTVVNTPSWIFGGDKLSILPIFHNGYITILLKSGLVGLFLFINGVKQLINYCKYSYNLNINSTYSSSLLLLSILIILMLNTLVTHGIYKTTSPFILLLLIGLLLNKIQKGLQNAK